MQDRTSVKKLSRKQVVELSQFKTNELVIIKNPIHLKRNPAHKPYSGPFKATSQTKNSVTLTLVSNPAISKVVKTSEVFKFRESNVPLSQVEATPGLKLVLCVTMDSSN